jgi:hypothetical protein
MFDKEPLGSNEYDSIKILQAISERHRGESKKRIIRVLVAAGVIQPKSKSDINIKDFLIDFCKESGVTIEEAKRDDLKNAYSKLSKEDLVRRGRLKTQEHILSFLAVNLLAPDDDEDDFFISTISRYLNAKENLTAEKLWEKARKGEPLICNSDATIMTRLQTNKMFYTVSEAFDTGGEIILKNKYGHLLYKDNLEDNDFKWLSVINPENGVFWYLINAYPILAGILFEIILIEMKTLPGSGRKISEWSLKHWFDLSFRWNEFASKVSEKIRAKAPQHTNKPTIDNLQLWWEVCLGRRDGKTRNRGETERIFSGWAADEPIIYRAMSMRFFMSILPLVFPSPNKNDILPDENIDITTGRGKLINQLHQAYEALRKDLLLIDYPADLRAITLVLSVLNVSTEKMFEIFNDKLKVALSKYKGKINLRGMNIVLQIYGIKELEKSTGIKFLKRDEEIQKVFGISNGTFYERMKLLREVDNAE